jgi:hypothetical protein
MHLWHPVDLSWFVGKFMSSAVYMALEVWGHVVKEWHALFPVILTVAQQQLSTDFTPHGIGFL